MNLLNSTITIQKSNLTELLEGKESSLVLELNASWAQLQGDKLIAFSENSTGKVFQFFDLKSVLD